jgi:hypothetical protein
VQIPCNDRIILIRHEFAIITKGRASSFVHEDSRRWTDAVPFGHHILRGKDFFSPVFA